MFKEQSLENLKINSETYSLKEIEKECLKSFSEDLVKISTNKDYTDFTCIVGKDKTKFQCHKLVLYTSSVFFQRLLKENGGLTSITLPQISCDSFSEILTFLYNGTLSPNIKVEEVIDVLMTSEYLLIKEIQEICFERLEGYSTELLNSEYFLNLNENILIKLLESNHFQIVSEYDLFQRVIVWLQKQNLDSNKLKETKEKLFSKIRFTLLTVDELEKLETMNILDNDSMNKIYKKIIKKEYEPRRGYLSFVYQTDFDENGVIYYIGCQDKKFKTNFSNPASNGLISISPFGNTKVNGNINDLFSRWNKLDLWLSASQKSGYIIDFKTYSLSVNSYTIRSFSQNCCFLRNWNLEGSNDGINWFILSQHVEPQNTSLPSPNCTQTFHLTSKKEFYRFIRIHQVGQNSSNWNFGLGGIEFYGLLK